MKLVWGELFPGRERTGRADGTGAIYLYLDVTAQEGVVKVYAMNPFLPLCPINRNTALRYAETDTAENAKDIAQQWESEVSDSLEGIFQ